MHTEAGGASRGTRSANLSRVAGVEVTRSCTRVRPARPMASIEATCSLIASRVGICPLMMRSWLVRLYGTTGPCRNVRLRWDLSVLDGAHERLDFLRCQRRRHDGVASSTKKKKSYEGATG